MARCGWCGATGMRADAPADRPQAHSMPSGGTCRGYGGWSERADSYAKRSGKVN